MRKKTSNLLYLLLVLFLFSFPNIVVFAQEQNADCDPGKKICNPIKSENLTNFFIDVFQKAIRVGIPLIVLALIYCGFLFVSARGNSEKINKAKDALLYTIIGAAILLGSMAIAQIVSSTVSQL